MTKTTQRVNGVDVVVEMFEEIVMPFEDAMFYDSGETYAKVTGPGGTYYVEAQGDKCVMHDDGRDLRRSEDFRAAFPDGKLPDDGEDGWEWFNNSWWAVTAASDQVGEDDEVCDSFESALATAVELAARDKGMGE